MLYPGDVSEAEQNVFFKEKGIIIQHFNLFWRNHLKRLMENRVVFLKTSQRVFIKVQSSWDLCISVYTTRPIRPLKPRMSVKRASPAQNFSPFTCKI